MNCQVKIRSWSQSIRIGRSNFGLGPCIDLDLDLYKLFLLRSTILVTLPFFNFCPGNVWQWTDNSLFRNVTSSFLMSLFYSSSVSSAQEQQQYSRSRQSQGRDEQSASWRRPDSEPHRRIRITTWWRNGTNRRGSLGRNRTRKCFDKTRYERHRGHRDLWRRKSSSSVRASQLDGKD